MYIKVHLYKVDPNQTGFALVLLFAFWVFFKEKRENTQNWVMGAPSKDKEASSERPLLLS